MVWVRERLGAERVSERRACQVLGQARSTQRRERHIPDDEARLVAEMVELATHYGRYGYRRITAMLRWEGWKVNHKRVERLWRQEGLKVPSRQPKRRRLWLHDGSCVRLRAAHKDHVWSYDFVHERTHDGRAFRLLTLLDEYTRECLAIEVQRQMNHQDVLDRLAELFVDRGVPEYIDWRQLEFPATTNRNPRFFRADPDHEDMVKDQQVRRLVKLRKNEKTLTMAAARAGLSRKTARKYLKSGKLPSQCQPERYWRTRSDPFESVWPEVEEILKRSPTVEATAVFEYLCRQQEGAFQQGQLRTLQRRIKQWKVEHGEAKEVMFPQKYRPGHQAQSDFTFMGRLGVTIQGQPFPHLLYHFVLAYSNWEATTLCFSESFESLSLGLQNALWELGALPEEHRTDRLSAAVNNLKREEFTERYQGLLNHFGMRSSRTQAGKAHENGDVEQAHHRLKRAIEQELLLRCSRDFSSREEYEGFVAVIVARRNAARQKRLGEELAVMRPLPARRLDDFTRQWVKVSPSSTIRVRHNTYSVDSRLIGERVQVRVWADQVEIYYGGRSHSRMPRLRGEGKHRIDYRHVIHSLVRKPGAFLRYRWREDLFPGILFRVAYDELRQDCPATADRQYLKILELAAQEGEQRVREALQGLIERGQRIRFEALRECLVDPVVEPWKVAVEKMDVGLYDTLLESREVRS